MPLLTIPVILEWADLLWVPLAALVIERGKKLKTVGFVLCCALALRLQVELLNGIGMERGFFGLLDSAIMPRGQITYGVFILLFLIIAYLSPGSDKHVHLAASITILITAFCVSTIIMVL